MVGRLRLLLSLCWHFFFSGGALVVSRALRRKKVGPVVRENGRGVIPRNPQDMLAETNRDLQSEGLPSIDLDTYALARALNSEHGSESETVRTWVAWAIRNNADNRKTGVYERLTTSRGPASGMFARQRTDARYAATNQAPTYEDVQIAHDVLNAPASADPTGGATNFFSPRTQNILFAKAQAGDPRFVGRITVDAEGLRQRWARNGLVSIGEPPGAPAGKVEFFRRANA